MNIAVFGTGYVGLTTGACLANLGHSVTCVDIDTEKIAKISRGEIPFFEPGLSQLVQRTSTKGKLQFTTDAKVALQEAKICFNCVGTPQDSQGAANLRYVFAVAKTIAEHAQQGTILINKSTVPPGTAAACDKLIKETNPHATVEVVSNPEFLKEGAAIHDFNHPNKIVIGSKSEAARNTLRKVYLGRMRSYIPFVETNWESAELIKYANNSFLSTKISFINEIANLCDYLGADIKTVAQALGMDYRISPKFLGAGIGYGGSCFPKDVRALVNTAKEHGYDANLLREVDAFNTRQKKRIVSKILDYFKDQGLAGKKLAVLGLSFKPKTSDMREAPSLTIIPELLAAGANIAAYDPIAIAEAKHEFEEITKQFPTQLQFHKSSNEAITQADALIILTEWDEFRSLDLQATAKLMKSNVIFDGRNIYSPQICQEEGFDYYGMGQ